MEPQAEHAPLLEVKLELFESEIRWVPEVSAGTDSGVHAMLDSWIVAFQSVGSLVSRLDADEGEPSDLLKFASELTTAFTIIQHAEVCLQGFQQL